MSDPVVEPLVVPKRRRKRATETPDLRGRLERPIARVAEWLAERDPELSEVLREDGPKMAKLLARAASHPKSPRWLVGAVEAAAGLLEPLDAFGRLLRLLAIRLRERRLRAREEAEAQQAEEAPASGFAQWPPSQVDVVPERFRVDAEPPETS
jgi:hypothetical protein